MVDKEVNRYGRYRITVHAVGLNTISVLQRWQRRWFVLYDDGELTYSVDEHVSKACNLILEVNSLDQILLTNYLFFLLPVKKLLYCHEIHLSY
ncbi:Protein outspread [Trachymyrmex cornetzi]|uniref:Protein outspread n=1 Tax=Trachymyrmex cornetzi TaxID=471704 RepID=A0A195EMR1_9HYME|nr:Protein outspread [Trachymyrmex cornetzi]